MRADDVPAAFELRLTTRENTVTMEQLAETYGVTPQSVCTALNAGRACGWLCEDAGSVVGFAMGKRRNGEVPLVIAVRPGYENQGIGARLLHEVVAWLRAQGHDEVWLLSNPDPGTRAYGFYRHLGWRTTRELMGDDEILRLPRAAG